MQKSPTFKAMGCIKNILALLGVVFILLIILFCLYCGHIYLCGGYIEEISTRFIDKYGGVGDARAVVDLISEVNSGDDCSHLNQISSLESICGRRPAEECEQLVDIIVKDILEKDKPYFNRVLLIKALESITGESFRESGFPLSNKYYDKIPEEESVNVERGLNYIRDWWQKRKEAEHSDTKK